MVVRGGRLLLGRNDVAMAAVIVMIMMMKISIPFVIVVATGLCRVATLQTRWDRASGTKKRGRAVPDLHFGNMVPGKKDLHVVKVFQRPHFSEFNRNR